MALRITVIGSSGKISKKIQVISEAIGQKIAQSGALLITGGRDGVMEAASRGAKKEQGITIGILPDKDKIGANPYVDIAIPTGLGFARNYINVISSDVIISIGGAGGTLSELGFAIALQKPLILMTGTGGVTDMIAQHHSLFPDAEIYLAKTPSEALRISLNHSNKRNE